MNTNICAVCAWRATCQKMFSVSGRDIRCADFVKDLTLQKEEKKAEGATEEENKKN